MSNAGYSNTPLARKLGIKPGHRVLLISAPDGYRGWLGDGAEGAVFATQAAPATADVVHLFARDAAELAAGLQAGRSAMKTDGALWISWAKRAAKMTTDLTEAVVRDAGLATDLVDVKVCAVTDLWSGLKFVVRKALR